MFVVMLLLLFFLDALTFLTSSVCQINTKQNFLHDITCCTSNFTLLLQFGMYGTYSYLLNHFIHLRLVKLSACKVRPDCWPRVSERLFNAIFSTERNFSIKSKLIYHNDLTLSYFLTCLAKQKDSKTKRKT